MIDPGPDGIIIGAWKVDRKGGGPLIISQVVHRHILPILCLVPELQNSLEKIVAISENISRYGNLLPHHPFDGISTTVNLRLNLL